MDTMIRCLGFFCKPSLRQSLLVHNPPMVFYPRISFTPERTDPIYNEQEYPAASTAEDNISITSITYSVQIIVYLSRCMIGPRILETCPEELMTCDA